MKQTAVEWLMDKLFDPSTMVQEQIQWFQQAKQMEKEQTINANRDGVDMVVNKENFITGEQYYNQTYQSNKD
jgi:hypothetical protein